jgi:hypothetical protein
MGPPIHKALPAARRQSRIPDNDSGLFKGLSIWQDHLLRGRPSHLKSVMHAGAARPHFAPVVGYSRGFSTDVAGDTSPISTNRDPWKSPVDTGRFAGVRRVRLFQRMTGAHSPNAVQAKSSTAVSAALFPA